MLLRFTRSVGKETFVSQQSDELGTHLQLTGQVCRASASPLRHLEPALAIRAKFFASLGQLLRASELKNQANAFAALYQIRVIKSITFLQVQAQRRYNAFAAKDRTKPVLTVLRFPANWLIRSQG